MLNVAAAKRRPEVFRALTSLNVEEFDRLTVEFKRIWSEKQERTTMRGSKRERAAGAGKAGILDLAESKLFFVLFYFTVYPIQHVQGFFFGMSQPNACQWIHRLTPMLERVLGRKMCLPKRAAHKVEEIFRDVPDLFTLMDCTERPIRRPGREPRQRSHYSGKRKRHTIKNLILSDKRRVLGLGRTAPGTVHDIRLAQEVALPKGTRLLVDSGFQGLTVPGVTLVHPIKKPRGTDLSPAQKALNRQFSSWRVRIEHVVGGVKRSHIIADTYRNFKAGFDDLSMLVACGLHNFRVECRSRG
jgi:hypothetical protein